jgi:hypothetical protein
MQGYLWIIWVKLTGVFWIIWLKIGSSLIFYFVAIEENWSLEIADPPQMCAETYTRPGTVPQRLIIILYLLFKRFCKVFESFIRFLLRKLKKLNK